MTYSAKKDPNYFGYISGQGTKVGPDIARSQPVFGQSYGRKTCAWEGDTEDNEPKKDPTKLSINGQVLRGLDDAHFHVGHLHPKLEIVYLRGDQISSLSMFSAHPLGCIRVLDLSFNDFSANELSHLAGLTALEQLYVSGNRLRSLEALPVFPKLETLVASNCSLTSLNMPVLPSLTLLVVNENRLESLRGIPKHPKLEALQCLGNEGLTLRGQVDTSAVLMCGDNLAKIQTQGKKFEEITAAVIKKAHEFPPYCKHCLTLGWLLPSEEELATEGLTTSSLAHDFLRKLQQRTAIPETWEFEHLSIEAPVCGIPCMSNFELVETLTRHGLHVEERDLSQVDHSFQWFKTKDMTNWEAIEGATKQYYISGDDDVGFSLKVVCTVNEEGFMPLYALTTPVVMGSAIPKAVVSLEGEPLEGDTVRASVVVTWCTTRPGTGVWEWWRVSAEDQDAKPEQIHGEFGSEYVLSVADVGYNVSARYFPVSEEGIRGTEVDSRLKRSIDDVQAHFPECRGLIILGRLVAGNELTCEADYFGGNEGPSEYQWFRSGLAGSSPEVDEETGEEKPLFTAIPGETDRTYEANGRDVGCFLKITYTPINECGERGETVDIITPERMGEGDPVISELFLDGTLLEGETVRVDGLYSGGKQGDSLVQWFTVSDDGAPPTPLGPPATTRELQLPPAAVDKFLEVHYTPIRMDTLEGKTKVFRTEEAVEMADPALLDMKVEGRASEGSVLEVHYTYRGGREGDTVMQWYRCPAKAESIFEGTAIEGATQSTYEVTVTDFAHSIFVSAIPVRYDGLRGDIMECSLKEEEEAGSQKVLENPEDLAPSPAPAPNAVMRLADPCLVSLDLEGEPKEGGRLRALPVYYGSAAHKFEFQWYRQKKEAPEEEAGSGREILYQAMSEDFTLTREDVGCVLCVQVTPMRLKDQMRGLPVETQSMVVGPADPVLRSVRLTGEVVEGGELGMEVDYYGGKMGGLDVVWSRVLEDGELQEAGDDETLTLGLDDVGHVIKAAVVPVRSDGQRGAEVEVSSFAKVVPAPPRGVSLSLPATAMEQRPLVPQRAYTGGHQADEEEGPGAAAVEWFCVQPSYAKNVKGLKAEDVRASCTLLATKPTFTPVCLNLQYEYLLVIWTPTRNDGVQGEPLLAVTKVKPLGPEVFGLFLEEEEKDPDTCLPRFIGDGTYKGGVEGQSRFEWWRQTDENGTNRERIKGAVNKEYRATFEDYNRMIVFSYTPIRVDGEVGDTEYSEPSELVLPPPPSFKTAVIEGKCHEAEPLRVVVEVLPASLPGNHPAPKVSFVWKRAASRFGQEGSDGEAGKDIGLAPQTSFTSEPLSTTEHYTTVYGDIGSQMVCSCTATDMYGRTSKPQLAVSSVIEPGLPRISELQIGWFPPQHNQSAGRPVLTGTPRHSFRYVALGKYVGGFEGASTIRWSRRSPTVTDIEEPIQVSSKDNSLDACIDDVGYVLVAEYKPVRSDGVEGEKTERAESRLVKADQDIEDEAAAACQGDKNVKYDVDLELEPKQRGAPATREKRILEMNKKRIKLAKTGLISTSLHLSEVRGTYAKPFKVKANRKDDRRADITMGEGSSAGTYTVHFATRKQRDVAVRTMCRFVDPWGQQ